MGITDHRLNTFTILVRWPGGDQFRISGREVAIQPVRGPSVATFRRRRAVLDSLSRNAIQAIRSEARPDMRGRGGNR
jgi:hypothetical protein